MQGIGISFRPELAVDLLRSPQTADFLEVVAEACFATDAARREARALSRTWPVVPHGVKLSLGSAEGIDRERARRLGALARDLNAPAISEHVAFVRAGGREIGHLTALPYTLDAVRVVARNVAFARRHLPDVPLLLENAAWTLRYPDDALDEGSFYTAIVEHTGCNLLLDLNNVYANAVNAGIDPLALLRTYPLERTGMIHLAGGLQEEGFYFDTHAHAVPEIVFELLAATLERAGSVPVVLERDASIPPFAVLAAELDRARGMIATTRRNEPLDRTKSRSDAQLSHHAEREIAAAQSALAGLLLAADPPTSAQVRPYGIEEITRSRAILARKRIDDAVPLLGRLAPYRERLRQIASTRIGGWPQSPRHAAIADAMRIAGAALHQTELAPAARLDLLLLRSRFVGPAEDGSVSPRFAPVVTHERLPGGRSVWAFKGIGAGAKVRLFQT